MEQRAQHIKAITQQLRIVFRAVQAHSKHVEKQCGVSSAKLWMLYELGSNPDIKVSKLAAALAIHPSTCSNMLDKLEEEGFVHRRRSTTDQRAVHLSLTEQGRSLLLNAPKPAQGELSGALEKLPDEHLALLENSLHELIQALSSKNESAGIFPISGE